MRASPYFEHPELDQRLFVEWGRAVARGDRFGEGPFLHAPLYPWLLGLIFRIAGDGLLLPRLVQSGLGTIAVFLVHRLGRRLFGTAVALLAAGLYATYWVTIYLEGELLREGVVDFVQLLGLWMTLQFADQPVPRRGVWAGLVFGVAGLLRQQILLFVPLLAGWLIWRMRMRLSIVALFVASAAVPILPITAYNFFVGGDFVWISPEGGQVLWIANHPGADGVRAYTIDTRADLQGVFADGRAVAEREVGRPLRPSQISSHYLRKTLVAARSDPVGAARRLLAKARLLLSNHEIGNPEPTRFFADRFAPIVRWLPLGFGFTLALAVVGILASWRGGSHRFLLWGFLLLHAATTVLFLVGARYRAPMMPVLLLYAANGIIALSVAALARRWIPFAAGSATALLVYAATVSVPVDRQASTANGLSWLAVAAGRDGLTDEASALFRESIALAPSSCEAHRGLGVLLFQTDRREEALGELRLAVALCPESVWALDTLAEMLLKMGRPGEAEALAARSIGLAPHLGGGHYNLGRTYAALGRLAEAAESFRRARARRPDDFNAAYMLGRLSFDLGRESEGISELAAAVELGRTEDGPYLFEAYRLLVEGLQRAGRRDEARSRADQMIRWFPGRREAVELRARQ
jgi:Flp pilus assembly protein TadD